MERPADPVRAFFQLSDGSSVLRMSDLICLLGAFFFFRLPWMFMLPMSQAPDEFAHYWVIKFLREKWCLPTSQDLVQGGASAVYGSLPQLGYLPHVLASWYWPDHFLALADRFGSLIAGGVMLFSAFAIGGILFPKNRLAALAIPAAVICHPQIVFIHSYANNDSTSSALASLLIWLMLETVSKGLHFKRTIMIGVLVGCLALTKYSGLAIVPVIGLAMLASIFIHGTNLFFAAGTIICAGLAAVLISAWWFIHNAHEFNGDFMGTRTMYHSWASTFHRDQNYYLPPSHIIKSLRWWRMTFFSYWGMFGYMTVYLWRPVYFAYLAFVLSSLGGALTGLCQAIKNKKPSEQGEAVGSGLSRDTIKSLVIWTSLALTLAVNLGSMIWASVYNLGGPQGRYLVTSEIPIMALIIGGMYLFGEKLRRWFIPAFIVFNAVVSIGSFIYLFNLYHGWHVDPLVL